MRHRRLALTTAALAVMTILVSSASATPVERTGAGLAGAPSRVTFSKPLGSTGTKLHAPAETSQVSLTRDG